MSHREGPYVFHAYEVSYFSAKVRPALRYKGVWFEERRANIGEILDRTGIAFIPVLVTPENDTWQDSNDIYEKLEARHPDPPLFPVGSLQRIAAQLINLYVDEIGLIPAMHYRWGSEFGEATARARFRAMVGDKDLGDQLADRMVAARHIAGATPGAGAQIEAHTQDLLAALCKHFDEHAYLLGGRQSFGDCALMGLMDGHMLSDLVSRRLLLESAWQVVGWLERTKFPTAREQGEWVAGDAIPPTLASVLEVIGSDAVPILLDLVRYIEDWADSNAVENEEPPRLVGTCSSELRGAPIERGAMPYTLLSVQRVLDLYANLSRADRHRVDDALSGTEWRRLLELKLRHRVKRDGFKLVFDRGA